VVSSRTFGWRSTRASKSARRPLGPAKVNAALAEPAPPSSSPRPLTLPACEHLSRAISIAQTGPEDLGRLAGSIATLAPTLAWRLKPSDDAVFNNGHANVDLVGPAPEALERRDDVRIGMSLMAPGITYPDHHHPPEEVYLVLSAGDWRQEARAWHSPGRGGIVYNPHNIVHAMRSSATEPLLAIWCLPLETS
jgi:quercetin dioxygenase-like cupin family protein